MNELSKQEGLTNDLLRCIHGALKCAFDTHGPLRDRYLFSAAKRVASQTIAFFRDRPGSPEEQCQNYVEGRIRDLSRLKHANRRNRQEVVLLRRWIHQQEMQPPSFNQLRRMYRRRKLGTSL